MPRVPKSLAQSYREKLARLLEQRMPFAYPNGTVHKLLGERWLRAADDAYGYPRYDSFGYDPYADHSVRDESFMVGFPAGERNIFVMDDPETDEWYVEPESKFKPEDFVPRRVRRDDIEALADAIYEEGNRFYPETMARARENWNKMIEPNPYPQNAWPKDRPNPSEKEFMDWRMGYFNRSDPNWSRFERMAQRDWNDYIKTEMIKRKAKQFR